MAATMISNDYLHAATPELSVQRPSTQLQTLNLLSAMGWQYLPPSACLAKRGSRRQVLLQSSLVEVMQTRRYMYQGQSHLLTPNGIEQIVRGVHSLSLQHGVLGMNAALYEKLRSGITITEFLPDGRKHQATIAIIDWQNRKANRYEVCEMMDILASQGKHVRQAGLVCFINGIPIAVIETASPLNCQQAAEVEEHQLLGQAIARHLQHQQQDEIALLYGYAQLLFACGQTQAKFATTLSPAAAWAHWQEEQFSEEYFYRLQNTPLSVEARSALLSEQALPVRNQFKQLWNSPQPSSPAQQLMMSLLAPQRLLEFLASYVIFDNKQGKMVANSQQFFAVRAMLDRMVQRNERGTRLGGIVGHASGTGRTLLQVFLSKAMLQHEQLKECRLILVAQNSDTAHKLCQSFSHSAAYAAAHGGKRSKVRSGHELARRISSGTERIIFTQKQKFHAASGLDLCYNPSHQLLVLIEEGQYSTDLAQRMRSTLPRASFLALAGTEAQLPAAASELFGPLLHHYATAQAISDGLLLPCFYEERTLLKIAASSDPENRQASLAADLQAHFIRYLRPRGLHAQLLCESRQDALRYQQLLQPHLQCAVWLAPDQADTPFDANAAAHSNPLANSAGVGEQDQHQADLLHRYAQGEIELLIIAGQFLQAGNDGRNALVYLDKIVCDQELGTILTGLNRPLARSAQAHLPHHSKQSGLLLDYRGSVSELASYTTMCAQAVLRPVANQYSRLPQLHQQLLALFQLDNEAARPLLNDSLREHLRQSLLPGAQPDRQQQAQQQQQRFFSAFSEFSVCLQLALSCADFMREANTECQLSRYKQSLGFFAQLRQVALQDAEASQQPIQHCCGLSRTQFDSLLHILFQQLEMEAKSAAASEIAPQNSTSSHWSEEKLRNEIALIQNRLRQHIEQALEDDPYAQQVYTAELKICLSNPTDSSLLRQFQLLRALEDKVQQHQLDAIPEIFRHRPRAASYFGLFRLILGDQHMAACNAAQQSAYVEQALAIDDVVCPALRENTLNVEHVEALIRSKLLPRLFLMLGMEQARKLIEQVIRIARIRARQAG